MTKSLQEAHRTLVEKVENMEIVVKSADKGEVTVIMSTNYYYEVCMNELNKEKVYKWLGKANPSNLVYKKVVDFANRHKNVLTKKEYQFLTETKYRIP